MKLKVLAVAVGAALTAAASSSVVAGPITVCDLTAINSSCTINGAIFSTNVNDVNIGSGIINPFLTTQNNGTESGFATDVPAVNQLPLDDKRDNANTFTNTLTLQNIGSETVGGQDYVVLFLDVNEPANADSLISLDTLKIYDTGSASPFLQGKPQTLAGLALLAALTLRYDLGDNSILLDANNFKGSGIGVDMKALIPLSDFDTTPLTDRLTLATAFGQAGGNAGTADGFEEWYSLKGSVNPPPPPPLPEPGTLALIGAALAGIVTVRRTRKTVVHNARENLITN